MLLYFNSLKAKQAMKKSKEESSAVQQPPAGKMNEIDLESQFRDVFFYVSSFFLCEQLPWFDRRSKEFEALQKIILDPDLLESFKYYTRFRYIRGTLFS